jgi:cytoskeleton protein RodZ
MDEETEVTQSPSVGERLRAAREEKGFSLEDIAAETRIPRRHLESLEAGDWGKLPAPTYSVGFAKSYASAVGLDRTDIGDQLRSEMGEVRNDRSTIETFEPADPARTMPRWLVLSAIVAIILVVLVFSWIRNQSLTQTEAPETIAEQPAQQAPAPSPGQAAEPAVPAQGPVVLTATGPAWIRVTDRGTTLFEGVLQPGQRYEVPPTATEPMLRVGAPEALRITVGDSVAPPVGAPGQVTSNVSLAPADLISGPGAQGAQQQQPPRRSKIRRGNRFKIHRRVSSAPAESSNRHKGGGGFMNSAHRRILFPAAALLALAAAPAQAQRPPSPEQRIVMLEQQLAASQAAADPARAAARRDRAAAPAADQPERGWRSPRVGARIRAGEAPRRYRPAPDNARISPGRCSEQRIRCHGGRAGCARAQASRIQLPDRGDRLRLGRSDRLRSG